ncbi:hypothetical protein EPI10_033216 [Gossypium australe]|uniref:Uncharacterized protein n=1 Tax=Gossypium australe TaxID=47621 RepID=A0A5B6X708_9ROSI|nr:hypothetical protein EPI10_033216 [Gossypium australe]
MPALHNIFMFIANNTIFSYSVGMDSRIQLGPLLMRKLGSNSRAMFPNFSGEISIPFMGPKFPNSKILPRLFFLKVIIHYSPFIHLIPHCLNSVKNTLNC